MYIILYNNRTLDAARGKLLIGFSALTRARKWIFDIADQHTVNKCLIIHRLCVIT